MKTKNLAELLEGESACVARLLSVGGMRRRLLDIGVIEGTEVCCSQEGPRGGLKAYLIRGAVIALRPEDARDILVTQAR